MLGDCSGLQFFPSSLFLHDYLSFIYMVFFVLVTKQTIFKEFNLDNGNNLAKNTKHPAQVLMCPHRTLVVVSFWCES